MSNTELSDTAGHQIDPDDGDPRAARRWAQLAKSSDPDDSRLSRWVTQSSTAASVDPGGAVSAGQLWDLARRAVQDSRNANREGVGECASGAFGGPIDNTQPNHEADNPDDDNIIKKAPTNENAQANENAEATDDEPPPF